MGILPYGFTQGISLLLVLSIILCSLGRAFSAEYTFPGSEIPEWIFQPLPGSLPGLCRMVVLAGGEYGRIVLGCRIFSPPVPYTGMVSENSVFFFGIVVRSLFGDDLIYPPDLSGILSACCRGFCVFI